MIIYTTVSRNFLFLRSVFFGTHNNSHARMSPLLTKQSLSDYCHAIKKQSYEKLRELEDHLDLPNGWFERDIQALSKISEEDFNSLQLFLKLPTEKKKAIKVLMTDLPRVVHGIETTALV